MSSIGGSAGFLALRGGSLLAGVVPLHALGADSAYPQRALLHTLATALIDNDDVDASTCVV